MLRDVLVAKNLTVGYKALNVAQNINFELRGGEFCAVVGINGIGKSTLLRTVANLQPTLEGEIKIHQKELITFSHAELAQELALVLTEPMATKNLTVQELVATQFTLIRSRRLDFQ